MKKHLSASGTNRLLLLHKQVHDKRSIAESLEAYINRDRLAVCEVCVFFISQLVEVHISISFQYFSQENNPPPPLRSYLVCYPWEYFREIMVIAVTQCVCVHERDLEQLCVHHDTLYCMYNGAMYWGGCLSFWFFTLREVDLESPTVIEMRGKSTILFKVCVGPTWHMM